MKKIWAVVEVCLVFIAIRVLIIPWLLPRFTRDAFTLNALNYLTVILVPIALLALTARDPEAYGISLRNLRYQLKIALDLFIPFALCDMLIGWLIPQWLPNAAVRWEGALIYIPLMVALLLVTGWMLSKRPGPLGMVPLLLVPLVVLPQQADLVRQRVLPFLYYLLLVGPGEEILFRGYIQTRLDQAFGCPRTSFGISWGWGLVIASLLFGIMHVFNGYHPLSGSIHFSWWWGLWTIFSGLVFGLLREKTGSVVAPALLHGAPQAIAALFLGVFAVR